MLRFVTVGIECRRKCLKGVNQLFVAWSGFFRFDRLLDNKRVGMDEDSQESAAYPSKTNNIPIKQSPATPRAVHRLVLRHESPEV